MKINYPVLSDEQFIKHHYTRGFRSGIIATTLILTTAFAVWYFTRPDPIPPVYPDFICPIVEPVAIATPQPPKPIIKTTTPPKPQPVAYIAPQTQSVVHYVAPQPTPQQLADEKAKPICLDLIEFTGFQELLIGTNYTACVNNAIRGMQHSLRIVGDHTRTYMDKLKELQALGY